MSSPAIHPQSFRVVKSDTAGLPPELDLLRSRPQWVVWKAENRDGRATKVPYGPRNHRLASVKAPSTWASYESATASAKRDHFDGTGFVMTETDGLACIDLDDAIVEGKLTGFARDVVTRFNSYTEISPSRRGLHVWIQAELPAGKGVKRDEIEIYDRRRYMTVSGDVFGEPLTIGKRQKELNELLENLQPRSASKVGLTRDSDAEPPSRLAALLAEHPRLAETWSRERQDLSDSSPSGYELSLATQLLRAGFEYQEIVNTLIAWRRKHRFPLGKLVDRQDYFDRTMAKAESGDYQSRARRPNQATQLVRMFKDARLCRTPHGDPFVRIERDGRLESYPLESEAHELVRQLFYQATRLVPGQAAVRDAVSALRGQARFDGGNECELGYRTAYDGEAIWLDLGEASWSAVRIDAKGWCVMPPVRPCDRP